MWEVDYMQFRSVLLGFGFCYESNEKFFVGFKQGDEMIGFVF